MKCVNMLDLAKVVSNAQPIEIVGKRPGEKTDEDLISEREVKRLTYMVMTFIFVWKIMRKIIDYMRLIIHLLLKK